MAKDEWRAQLKEVEDSLAQCVVQREHAAQVALLETWGFNVGVLNREMLNVEGDSVQWDRLFGADAKRHVKVGGGFGATVGAAVGGAIDACVGGLSFGAGALLGAFLGGLVGSGGALAYNVKYDPKEMRIVARVQKDAITALVARGIELVKKLQSRGKALDDSVQSTIVASPNRVEISGFFSYLEDVRKNWDYSLLNKARVGDVDGYDWRSLPGISHFSRERKKREDVVKTLADMLKQVIPDVE